MLFTFYYLLIAAKVNVKILNKKVLERMHFLLSLDCCRSDILDEGEGHRGAFYYLLIAARARRGGARQAQQEAPFYYLLIAAERGRLDGGGGGGGPFYYLLARALRAG